MTFTESCLPSLATFTS